MNLFRYRVHLWWLVPLLIFDAVFFTWLWKRLSSPLPLTEAVSVVTKGVRVSFAYPTDRELDRFDPDNFQPTLSGRPESALFGSVRTAKEGNRLVPSFHEGVDIAALERDKTGRPQDGVLAAADGEVAYVNRQAGNSNYGKYVVLLHDAGPGRVCTLYAHLAEISPGLKKGGHIEQGELLGIMGSTTTDRIPPANGHLHFEVCLLLNSRFQHWFGRQKLIPDHGNYNGWNLIGIDPLAVYEKQEENNGELDMYAHLGGMQPAFEILLRTPRQLDFFQRYPVLWQGAAFRGGVMVLTCSENGLPLSGRNADLQETAELKRNRYVVRNVDGSVLGRNGCRLVIGGNGKWRLSSEGEKWLSMLVY